MVLADPPYPLDNVEVETMLGLLVANDWLAAAAMVVLERSARSVEPTWPGGLSCERSKEYGETVLWYVRAGPGESHSAGRAT